MIARRPAPWIPPAGLVAGHIAHGASWIALLAIGAGGALPTGFRGLAWVHLVGVAWITVVALSVLIHVIPQFCDVRWRGERFARLSIVTTAIGAWTLTAGFWLGTPRLIEMGALVIGASLVIFLCAAFATILTIETDRVARAIGRALGFVLAMLAATAGVGIAMAMALADDADPSVLNAWPAAHAHLGAAGWLSLLIMGVSMRTLAPIAGRQPSSPLLHRLSGISIVLGTLALVVGLIAHMVAISWFGAVVLVLGLCIYLVELLSVLASATVEHRPPQAFLAAGGFWLAGTVVLGLGVLIGMPWQDAYAFVGLIGWIGQMVVGHLHHIGVRLLATMVRGDDDETEPGRLLKLPLSWLTFALFQIAIGCGMVGLLTNAGAAVAVAGGAGFAGWLAMTVNVAGARRMLECAQ